MNWLALCISRGSVETLISSGGQLCVPCVADFFGVSAHCKNYWNSTQFDGVIAKSMVTIFCPTVYMRIQITVCGWMLNIWCCLLGAYYMYITCYVLFVQLLTNAFGDLMLLVYLGLLPVLVCKLTNVQKQAIWHPGNCFTNHLLGLPLSAGCYQWSSRKHLQIIRGSFLPPGEKVRIQSNHVFSHILSVCLSVSDAQTSESFDLQSLFLVRRYILRIFSYVLMSR